MTEVKELSSTIIEDLLSVGAQYGYSKTRRHPSTSQFIFTTKNKIDIIDVKKTASQIDTVITFITNIAKSGKTLLVVGTKPEARKSISDYTSLNDIPFVKERWIGGTITNLQEIKKRVKRLVELREMQEKGGFDKYTKRETLDFTREMEKLEKHFGGIVSLSKTPDVILLIDPRHENIALKEASQLNIPIIAIASSDCDISDVTYPIVSNDNTQKSINYIIEKIAKTYKDNYQTPVQSTDNDKVKIENKKS